MSEEDNKRKTDPLFFVRYDYYNSGHQFFSNMNMIIKVAVFLTVLSLIASCVLGLFLLDANALFIARLFGL